MNARWAEAGVGAVRDEDGVWRPYGDTKEFADPTNIREEDEESAIEAFFPLDHNEEVSATLAILSRDKPSIASDDELLSENTRSKSSASDDELLSPWELELEIREATIDGLSRKIAESEKALRVLATGKITMKGRPQRLAQLRKRLGELQRELEEERSIAQSRAPKPGPVVVVFHRQSVRSDTVRARRPRDPNKIQ